MTRDIRCGGVMQGRLCNYPIRMEEETGDYQDNDPGSRNYGKDIQACPRCGERLYLWKEHTDRVNPLW
ncbi:MAG TPA: hypothetical protein VK463_08380 [Desulfomonilaceae bacterium]|nr:hypothetical protein [Desulfomonilaceae bacterium]